MSEEQKTAIVTPDGRPAKRKDDKCPQCRAEADKRVATSGFGPNKNVCCGVCGYAFGEEEE